MNNSQRVDRLEEKLGVNQAAETLDEMVEKYWRKQYGPNTVMGLVSVAAAHMRAADKEALDGYIESLRSRYPGQLVDFFADALTITMQDIQSGGPRDQRPDESKADYLRYQIKECLLVVGWQPDKGRQ